MTTVAAIADGEHVYMAADSRNNVHSRPVIDGARKIARIEAADGAAALLGFCGAGCLAQVIPGALKLDGMPDDDDQAAQQWAHDVARNVTEIAYDLRIVNERGNLDGTLMLGTHGRLWTLTDYQAIPHRNDVAAVGSGDELAMGAMLALHSTTDHAATVRIAVQIACELNDYTDEPIYVEHV